MFLTSDGYITDGNKTTGFSWSNREGFYDDLFVAEFLDLPFELACGLNPDERPILPLMFILGDKDSE